jgi:hypothetical protein
MVFLVDLLTSIAHTIADIAPIVIVILFFQWGVLHRRLANPMQLGIGIVCVILGMALFLLGLEKALFPLGETMARQLTSPAFLYSHNDVVNPFDWRDYLWVYGFAAAIGFSTTIAEPSLLAVAMKANDVSGGTISVWGLRASVALGVSIGLALGSYRIVVGDPIQYYIITGYIFALIQTLFTPRMMVPLAYDSGGVTTSTVTVPLVAALGLGLAETVPGRSPMIDGFGLIAFASLFPMITVMGYAQLTHFLFVRGKGRSDN